MTIPKKFLQTERQTLFSSLARQWRGLTEAQRTTWYVRAAAVPVPTRLNPNAYLDGFNYFLWYNSVRMGLGLASLLTDAGTGTDTGTFSIAQLILDGGQLAVEVNLSGTTDTYYAQVYATPIIPFGQEWIKYTPKLLKGQNATSDPVIIFQSQYQAAFNQVPVDGQWIGLQVKFWSTTRAIRVDTVLAQVELHG